MLAARDHDRDARGDRGDARAHEERRGEAVVGRQRAPGDRAAGEDRGRDLRADRGADRAHERVEAGRLAGLRRRDRLDDQVRHRRERQADAGRHHERPGDHRELRVVVEREPEQPEAGDRGAARERQLGPEAGAQLARDRAREQHHQGARQQQQPRASGVEPEAEAGRLRQLGELRDQQERAEHAEADEQRRDVRHQHRRLDQRRDVGERLLGAALDPDPDRQHGEAGDDQPERLRAAPAPGVGARDRDQRHHEADAEQRGAAQVDATRRALGRLRHPELGRQRREGRGDRAEPEDPVVGEVVGDQAAGDQAGAAADAEDRADQADAPGDLLARELVADDAEAEREDAAAEALEHAAEHDELERAAERGDGGAEAEREQREDEQAPLAEHVAEPAGDRGRDRGREQVAGQHPRDPATRRCRAGRSARRARG